MSKLPENLNTTSESLSGNSQFVKRESEIKKKLETGEIKKLASHNNFSKDEIDTIMRGIRAVHREMEENGGNLPEIKPDDLYADFD